MIKNTPPMGYNTWNTFGANINEELILGTADKIVELGLDKCGYEYVVIDDCWSLKERNEKGELVADPEKFPHGMKYVADYVHSKGLKFGMYSCAGYVTCAGYPASYDYEFIDANTFASWGVDFLKYDYCFHSSYVPGNVLYRRMGLALANCGRDILFSACSWGADNTKHWIKETGASMWRSTGDVSDRFESVKNIIKQNISCLEYNGKGCFNDMDMLIVGMGGKGNVGAGGCSYDEYMVHFAFWCFCGSPLMIGCDVRNMTEDAKKILTNKDLIRIDQDGLYSQPFFLEKMTKAPSLTDAGFYDRYPDEVIKLGKLLDDGTIAIGIFNLSDWDLSYWNGSIFLEDLGISPASGKTAILRDAFDGHEETFKNGIFTANCKAHSCRVFIARVVDK